MKTIGLIGGMSWESTLEYYRIINETIKKKLGGSHSAKILLYSFDFEEIEYLQHKGDWRKLSEIMIDVAWVLKNGGADFLVICTNTMHKLADDIVSRIDIPLLHIVDVVAEKILDMGLRKVGLLGTRFTMEEGFYADRLRKFGIDIIIPTRDERKVVHNTIYTELVKGIINSASRERFKKIIEGLKSKGAQGIILGCTEIPLLIKQENVDIPVFDTTEMHAVSAAEKALKGE